MNSTSAFRNSHEKHSILNDIVFRIIALMVIFFFLNPLFINAQKVLIDLGGLHSPANLWRIEDILNVSILNISDEILEVKLKGELYESNSGYSIEVLCDDKVVLNPGETEFIYSYSLQSCNEYHHLKADDLYNAIKNSLQTTGSLPAGNYKICVIVNHYTSGELIRRKCTDIYIAHPSPPELILPYNESAVAEDLPIFSWLPPMPSSGDVSYTIEMVEILDGQSPMEAMETNLRWLNLKMEPHDITSYQYGVGHRDLIPGQSYAWKVSAFVGPEDLRRTRSIVESPVWKFTYMGSADTSIFEQYQLTLKAPDDGTYREHVPFFEWKLSDPSDTAISVDLEEEDIYFDIKIWKWPDTLDANKSVLFKQNILTNQNLDSYYTKTNINTAYFNISGIAPDTLMENYTYVWQVIGFKNEMEIAKSDLSSFTIFSDISFMEAAESLMTIDVKGGSKIYGVVDPIPRGATIESEERTDIDIIEVTRESYLFIIDEEPFTRFGHPVQYVLVDKETTSVDVYQANWFPAVKHSVYRYEFAGAASLEGLDMGLLGLVLVDEDYSGEIAEKLKLRDVILGDECGKHFLIIDGGDSYNTNSNSITTFNGFKKADSLKKVYEDKGFEIKRFSQYSGTESKSIEALPVDSTIRCAADSIKMYLRDKISTYEELNCCNGSGIDLELRIYIWAYAIPNSTSFMLYKPFSYNIYEKIDYKKDILKYLHALPKCVKIFLYINDCFIGSKSISEQLESDINSLNKGRTVTINPE